MTVATPRATLADLMRVEGKAELIGGKVVELMANGHRPGRVALRIVRSLDDYAEQTGKGIAHADGVGYAVPELTSTRESFCPDASYYVGPLPADDMWFLENPPTLAVEVRSDSDYGKAAEFHMAEKRADYFEAGTPVVWDVDPVNKVIHCYLADSPDSPTTFSAGQIANAEPAVPGWTIAVEDVFKK